MRDFFSLLIKLSHLKCKDPLLIWIIKVGRSTYNQYIKEMKERNLALASKSIPSLALDPTFLGFWSILMGQLRQLPS